MGFGGDGFLNLFQFRFYFVAGTDIAQRTAGCIQ